MGLKELKSNLDLVQGEGPVGGMSDLTVPNFQLATDAASTKHIDSLQNVPGGDSNSPYQDINGQTGPQFDLGPNSSLQQDSLLTKVPGGDSNSPFQDLDGAPGPQFQKETSAASQVHVDSLASIPGGDSNSPFQDLDGIEGPQFQKGNDIASQAHISSLSTVPGGDSNSPFQDRGDGATPGQYLDNLPS